GLLDRATRGRHEHELIFAEFLDGQHHVDLLAIFQREHIDDRTATRVARTLWHFPDLEPVHTATVGEAQQVIVRVGDEQLVDPVVLFHGGGLLATATTTLGPVFGQRLALDVAGMRERHHHIHRGDQVFGIQLGGVVLDLRATNVLASRRELVAHGDQFVTNNGRHTSRVGQDVQQVSNLVHDLAVLLNNLVLLQASQALQAHVQDFLSLHFAQTVQTICVHAKFGTQIIRTVSLTATHNGAGVSTGQHLAYQTGIPGTSHQLDTGNGWRRSGFDDFDELINIGQGYSQTFQHMTALARFTQLEYGAACHHFTAVAQEVIHQLFQVEQTGLAIDQCHHVHPEGFLQLRILVEVVQHNFRHFAALQFNDQTHAILVGLVANIGDTLDALFVDQLGNTFLQRLLVDLIRDGVDHDGLTVAVFQVFKVRAGTHDDAATARAIAFAHTGHAINNGASREVGGRDVFDQFINRALGVAQAVQTAIDHFSQVMRRNIGGHTHGNTRAAVNQQVGQTRRQQ